jgi:hypothetical protein
MDPRLRKRILMFYFAAGINIVMAVWVFSVGGTQIEGGTLSLITLVFIGFAGLNYYMARSLQKKWARAMRQQREAPPSSEGA